MKEREEGEGRRERWGRERGGEWRERERDRERAEVGVVS